mgnify:CR=1 FL=1
MLSIQCLHQLFSDEIDCVKFITIKSKATKKKKNCTYPTDVVCILISIRVQDWYNIELIFIEYWYDPFSIISVTSHQLQMEYRYINMSCSIGEGTIPFPYTALLKALSFGITEIKAGGTFHKRTWQH